MLSQKERDPAISIPKQPADPTPLSPTAHPQVYDLIEPKETDLPIREDFERNIVVPNLCQRAVRSYEEFATAYNDGLANRRVAATKLNAHSSRSHAVLTVTVRTDYMLF